MNEREREICARVRFLRQRLKFSQADFAEELRITRDKQASIDYGFTPLNFVVAHQICSLFQINPRWLATGLGLMTSPSEEKLPDPMKQKRGALFSDVFDNWHKKLAEEFESYSSERRGSFSVPNNASGRVVMEEHLIQQIKTWLECVPDSKLNEFANKIIHLGEELMDGYPARNQKSRDKLVREMGTVRASLAARRRLLQKKSAS